jgi:hypothetical protein
MSDVQGKRAASVSMPEQTRGQDEKNLPPTAAGQRRQETPEVSGWVGWISFASVMMVLVGSFQVINGLVALFDDGYYVVTESQLVVNVDYTAWGWAHLLLGALTVGAGFALMAGRMWARVVAIALALVSAVVNMAFIAAYPIWSLTVIAVDVLVIYAVTAHGSELKALRD